MTLKSMGITRVGLPSSLLLLLLLLNLCLFFSFQIFLHICSPPCPQVLCRISTCFSSSICKCILFLDSKLCKLVLFPCFISYNRSYFKCLFSGVCFVFEIFLYAMISHLKPCGCHSQGYAW